MKDIVKFWFMGIGIAIVMCAAFSAVVMLLWNALMPQIFAIAQISYLQAAGLLVLARLLFGGGMGCWRRAALFGARGNERLFHQGNKLREKWMNMSASEREEFVKKEKDFFKFHRGFSHFQDFLGSEKEEKK